MVDMATFPVLDAYLRLKNQVSLLAAAHLKDSEIGQKQMQVLYRLSLSPCTMKDLAEYSLSDKATMSRTVESLVKAGWVTRNDVEGDRRKRFIQLTSAGRKASRQAEGIRSAIGAHLQGLLSKEDNQKLVSLLEKLLIEMKPGVGNER